MTSRTADGVTVTYTYDDIGGLISADGPSGEITITRDRLGAPTGVEPDDGSADTTYTYGFTSGTRSDASGSYDFDFDEWGREVGIEAPIDTSSPFTFTWRPDGDRKQRSDPNGMDHDYRYSGGRLRRIVSDGSGCSGASCADIDYTYDRAGMRLSEASSIDGDPANGTATFAYDATGRLVAYGAPGSYDDQTYGWSEVLNREQTTTGTDTLSLLFDAADRPVSDSDGGTYTHDADGRMTAHPGGVLEWDSLGRLTAVRDEEGVLISAYTYDALDRLREVTTGGVTTRHRYVGITTQVAQLRDVTNKASVRYFATSWSGELLAQWKTDTTGRRYLGTSGHGDITWAATNVGIVDATVRYDPWGVEIATSGQAPFFGFQGSWIDRATGLYWVIARWYAPSLGAFISEDELLGEPDNPHSRHLYAYGWGDPVGNWDLDGLLVDRVLRTRATSRTVTRAREVQVREDLTIQGRYSIVRGNATWTVTASASGTKIVSSLHMRIVVPYGATCSNCVWITKAKATFLRSDFHVIKQVWPRRNRRCGASIDRPRPKAKVFHFCATSISLPKSATQVKFKWEFSMLQSGGTAQGHSGGALFRQKYRTGILAPKR